MPQPKHGMAYLLHEQVDQTGEVTRSLEQRLPDLGHDDDKPERDLDKHYTLSNAYPAGHQHLIEAGKVIRLEPPSLFTKFEVLIFDNVSAFIGLDRDAGSGPGQYDRRHPGTAVDDQRCTPRRVFTILFEVVPANPVEVYLYGGRPSQAK